MMRLTGTQWAICFALCMVEVFGVSRLGTGWFIAGFVAIFGLQIVFALINSVAYAKAAQQEHAAHRAEAQEPGGE